MSTTSESALYHRPQPWAGALTKPCVSDSPSGPALQIRNSWIHTLHLCSRNQPIHVNETKDQCVGFGLHKMCNTSRTTKNRDVLQLLSYEPTSSKNATLIRFEHELLLAPSFKSETEPITKSNISWLQVDSARLA